MYGEYCTRISSQAGQGSSCALNNSGWYDSTRKVFVVPLQPPGFALTIFVMAAITGAAAAWKTLLVVVRLCIAAGPHAMSFCGCH